MSVGTIVALRSIDKFFHRSQTNTYNCFDFVHEVWLDLFGEDIRLKMLKLVGDFANRKFTVSGMKGFKRLSKPESPCFVLMQRTKLVPHVGIYLNGRVLHLHSKGVEYQPLNVARRYFTNLKYYR